MEARGGDRMEKMPTGHIKDYDVFVFGNTVVVLKGNEFVTRQQAQGLGDFLDRVKDLRLGWGSFPDFDVIYLYDKADGNFGYAVNLQDPVCSEWVGPRPFATPRRSLADLV
jgi:hypothetical protein